MLNPNTVVHGTVIASAMANALCMLPNTALLTVVRLGVFATTAVDDKRLFGY